MTNIRTVSVFSGLFCGFRAVRKRCGGKWEKWSVDSVVFDFIWYPVEYYSHDEDKPFQGCIKLLKREDWE